MTLLWLSHPVFALPPPRGLLNIRSTSTSMALSSVRVVIVPGNGAGNVHTANWYGWLFKKLQRKQGVTAVLENMPGTQREGVGLGWVGSGWVGLVGGGREGGRVAHTLLIAASDLDCTEPPAKGGRVVVVCVCVGGGGDPKGCIFTHAAE